MTATVPLGFAIFLTIVSVVMVALSFSTDHWIDTLVNRDKIKGANPNHDGLLGLNSEIIYFKRYRGLFRTCFPGNDTAFLDSNPDRTDGNCLIEKGYELSRRQETIEYGDDYDIRIHLMRAHFCFFCISMLLMVIACIIGAFGCWNNNSAVLRTSGLLMFLGGFFAAGGMAFFHGYEYLEKTKIELPMFPAVYDNSDNTQYALLQEYSSSNYGYSYIVGWIGMGVAVISAILYLAAASSVSQMNHRRRMVNEDIQSLKRSERNRAYNYYPEQPTYGGHPYPPAGYGYDMGAYNKY